MMDLRERREKIGISISNVSRIVKKATTGYAGGHKEFHLWIEKENLR